MKYIAEVANVREVTLIGSAEPDVWEPELIRVGLFPFLRDHRVELFISAVVAKWKGKRFCESALAIAACREEDASQPDGYFMAGAFHSSPLFGWIERTCFKTSHMSATIALQDAPPTMIDVRRADVPLIRATMGKDRAPARNETVDWAVTIFLPHRGSQTARKRNLLYVRIAGATEIFDFAAGGDAVTANAQSGHVAVGRLTESNPIFQEWHIRRNSTHARSKTFGEAL